MGFNVKVMEDGSIIGAKGKKLKTYINNCGYEEIKLYSRELKKNVGHRVHRLVAKAFLPNPDNLPVVNHKDGNKLNNHVSNLEWASQSSNIKHTFTHLGRKPLSQELRNKMVQVLLDSGEFTHEQIASFFDVSPIRILQLKKRFNSNTAA